MGSGGDQQQFYSEFHGNPTLAWWGYEAQNPSSDCGPRSSAGAVNLRTMRYQTNHGLTFYGFHPIYSTDTFDNCTDGSLVVGSWDFTNDMINHASDWTGAGL